MNNKKVYGYLLFCAVAFACMSLMSSCAFKCVKRSKGITYLAADSAQHIAAQQLNVFSSGKLSVKKNVLIFVHGGNWNSGERSLYNFFGNRMARKGIVTVVIDYPLSPDATYKEMAFDCAASVKWVKEHIASYGGDPERIFISGHSAGGHLSALVSADNSFFNSLGIANPIKGTILIDAGGLDMYNYLREKNLTADHTFLKTFTTDSLTWKKASPVYYLHKGMPAFLVYQGGETYPYIQKSNQTFMNAILPLAPTTGYHIIKGKKHVPMITQFLNSFNPRYKEIKMFMDGVK